MSGPTFASILAEFPEAFAVDSTAAALLDVALANQKSRVECGEPGLRHALATLSGGVSKAGLKGFPLRLGVEETIAPISVRDHNGEGGISTPFHQSTIHLALVDMLSKRKSRKADKAKSTGASEMPSLEGVAPVSSAAGFLFPDGDLRVSCGEKCTETQISGGHLVDILFVLEVKAHQPATTIERILERYRLLTVLRSIKRLSPRECTMTELLLMAKKGATAMKPFVSRIVMGLISDEPPQLISHIADGKGLRNIELLPVRHTWATWEEQAGLETAETEEEARRWLAAMDADAKTRVGISQTAAYLLVTAECGNGNFGTTVVADGLSRLLVNEGELVVEVNGHTTGLISDPYSWFKGLRHQHMPHDFATAAGKALYVAYLHAAVVANGESLVEGCRAKMARPALPPFDLAGPTVARMQVSQETASAIASVARSSGAEVTPKKRKARSDVDSGPPKAVRRDDTPDDEDGEGEGSERTTGVKGKGEVGQAGGLATDGAEKVDGPKGTEGSSRSAPSGASTAAPIALGPGDVAQGEEFEQDPHPLALGDDAWAFNEGKANATVNFDVGVAGIDSSRALQDACELECEQLDVLLEADESAPGHDEAVRVWLDQEGNEDLKLAIYCASLSSALRTRQFRLRAVSAVEMDARVQALQNTQLPLRVVDEHVSHPSDTADVSVLASHGALHAPVTAPLTATAMSRDASRSTPHLTNSAGAASESPSFPSPPSQHGQPGGLNEGAGAMHPGVKGRAEEETAAEGGQEEEAGA